MHGPAPVSNGFLVPLLGGLVKEALRIRTGQDKHHLLDPGPRFHHAPQLQAHPIRVRLGTENSSLMAAQIVFDDPVHLFPAAENLLILTIRLKVSLCSFSRSQDFQAN